MHPVKEDELVEAEAVPRPQTAQLIVFHDL